MPTLLERAFLKLHGKGRALALRYFAGPNDTTLEAALARCAARRHDVRTVLDIGASNGCWSDVCLRYFPEAFYFLVEAQQPHEADLQRFKREHPHSDYVLAAAGDHLGEIHFDATSLFGGVATHEIGGGRQITVPKATVDEQVRRRQLQGPFLLKLDTHGFEVATFEGAAETLRQTTLIIVETYNFPLHGEALRFPEMCAYLEKKGFRCIDVSDVTSRAKDGAFWQMDLYFAPATHPAFTSNTYK